MRIIAKSGITPIATNDIVLPVSDEMDCRACHASGSVAAAMPAAGWVWGGIQERDFRLNILRLHDEKQFASNAVLYAAALAAKGFNPQGLYRGVVADNRPILCAACHASEALGAPSYGTIPPLTASVHAFHAHVMDPVTHITLNNTANRSACYRCHPGSTTKCLRGAMGGAIATDGSMEMQCQSCHGNISAVGSPARVGWFMEPNCASCHTGTATQNSGQIRYVSAFIDTNFNARVPANQTFSTQPNTPAGGLSLFRFSAGHGGLQCEACHGSTHAEFPSIHVNDNVRDTALQGHAGVMVECTACHVSMAVNSTTATGGPHGMHPIGQSWVSGHGDLIQSLSGGVANCQACHGADFRGTVLSRAQDSRTLTANFDTGTMTLNLYRGAFIGCYNCHNGPANDTANASVAPAVNAVSGTTPNTAALTLPVTVSPTTATLRIIAQPANGSLGITNRTLTYFPNPGYIGPDTFKYAAWDGFKNSAAAAGNVSVTAGAYSISLVSHVPTNSPIGWPVAFATVPTLINNSNAVTFRWTFGDGSPASTNQFAQHTFAATGNFSWQAVATVGTASATNTGTITVTAPMTLTAARLNSTSLNLTWPANLPGVIVEQCDWLGGNEIWTPATTPPVVGSVNTTVTIPTATGNRFYRARRAW